MPGPRQIVDPPAFTPSPFGLLSVVEFPTPLSPHWENGITYQPNCATPLSTYDECIAITGVGGAPPPQSTFNVNSVSIAPRGATPFTVMVEFDCSAVGNEQARRIAETAMAGSESWQVERSFWSGLAGTGASGLQNVVFPHLAANAQLLDSQGILLQTAAVSVSGIGNETASAQDVVQALGLLEQALADCYNGVGVIHVPELLLPTLDAWGLIQQNGPQLRTKNGNRVAVGAGYPGTSPAGASRTNGASWMYATGAIFCFRGDILIRPSNTAEAFDKQKNTIKMIAERRYVLGWDCCHFAVNTLLGVVTPT